MSQQHQALSDDERLALIRTKAARIRKLRQQADEEEGQLRATVADARRAGLLVADLQKASDWSHQKLNTVLRAAGIPADRSAPRKRTPRP